jgi:hypothetical protein
LGEFGGAGANSEHAQNDMFLFPICQEKKSVPAIFIADLASLS